MDGWTIWIEELAKSSLSSPGTALPVYFLAGLLSAGLPCVYPLIPVTAAYIQKRSQKSGPRFKDPLVYWAGMVLSYILLGSLAAFSGGAFNDFMQSAPVILATGLLFLFLTYVMLDYHPLQIPFIADWELEMKSRQGFWPTLVMGLLAGLIASACVAPALAFMLLFIAEHAAKATTNGVLYGAALSGSFGLGIGLPFFLAGVLGSRLPRSGKWMSAIKIIFAALVLWFAFIQLEKGFLTLGFRPGQTNAILTGIGLILLAARMGLRRSDQEDKQALTRFSFALLFVVLGTAAILRGILPAGQDSTAEIRTEKIGNLTFHRNVAEARAESLASGKLLFIDFYADWCTNCKVFSKMMEKDEELSAALAKIVLLKVYDTDEDFQDFRRRHQELTVGLPFFLLLNSDNQLIWKSQSLNDIPELIRIIHRAAP